ncbi:MAG: hypothetical protein NVSMB42_18840 [Herpetosiphon sp.]
MLYLDFQGWWQNRMSNDPDPSDEPRGVSGPTFACPGEPDLDRIIRLQNPVMPRYPHEHDIGVDVYQVSVDDPRAEGGRRVLPEHPLMDAHVELLDGAKFDERNFVVLYQKMPIDPFHLRIASVDEQIVIERVDLFDITQPGLSYEDVLLDEPAMMLRRTIAVVPNSPVVAEATGVLDYAEHRRERRRQLEKLAEEESDRVKQAALQKRIRNLAKDDQGMAGTTAPAQLFLGLCGTYAFSINGPGRVLDPKERLGGKIGLSQDWPLQFWMGGFDVDTLCGYMRGTLAVTFLAT